MAVPTVMLNGEPFGQGRMTIEEILAKWIPARLRAMRKS
jgi:alkyl hydroperoxide reductase subunit AhpF